MIEKIVRWLIAKFLPGYHLHKTGKKGGRNHDINNGA